MSGVILRKKLQTAADLVLRTPLEIARRELGVAETPGRATNARIAVYQSTVGLAPNDETPWCSAFVNWCQMRAGVKGTGKPNARSWLTWGGVVIPSQAQPGDVVVFWRNSPNSWEGHVAFFLGFEGKYVRVLGGNQSNRVCEAVYPTSRILGIRRPE